MVHYIVHRTKICFHCTNEKTFISCFIVLYNLYKDSKFKKTVAFAPRRVSHVVSLISLVSEKTSEDCFGKY